MLRSRRYKIYQLAKNLFMSNKESDIEFNNR